MGVTGKSKKIALFLTDSAEHSPGSSDTYRERSDSPQGISEPQKHSCFVLVDNLVGGFHRCGRTRVMASDVQGDEGPRRDARQPVSRVLSAPEGAGRPFLWDASHDAPHATNPSGGTGTSQRLSRVFTDDTAAAPIRSCSRWGLPCRPCHQVRGALLPHRFALARGSDPLTRTLLHGRFVFCGTVPGVAPAGC